MNWIRINKVLVLQSSKMNQIGSLHFLTRQKILATCFQLVVQHYPSYKWHCLQIWKEKKFSLNDEHYYWYNQQCFMHIHSSPINYKTCFCFCLQMAMFINLLYIFCLIVYIFAIALEALLLVKFGYLEKKMKYFYLKLIREYPQIS